MSLLKKAVRGPKTDHRLKIRFRCRNCGHLFMMSFRKGYIIDKKADENKVEKIMIEDTNNNTEKIVCPNCLIDKIEIVNRYPIIDETIGNIF